MFCRKCGSKAAFGTQYCEYCGAEFIAAPKKAPHLKGSLFQPAEDVARPSGSTHPTSGLKDTLPRPAAKFFIPNDLADAPRSRASLRITPRYPIHEKCKCDPRFNRSPRLQSARQIEQIVLQGPPTVSAKPEISWLTVILPPLAMALLMVLVSLLSGGLSAYMLLMLPMQAISVVIAILNYKKQLSKHREMSSLRTTKYEQYLAAVQSRLFQAAQTQLENANAANPSTEECLSIGLSRKKNLWERRPEDSDFGCFRVGIGQIPADVTAVWTEHAISLVEDELEQKAAALSDSFRFIENAPIVLPNHNSIIGIVGDAASTRALAQQAVIQLSTLHSYEDLKICMVFSDAERESWSWAKWLPHTQNADSDRRLLALTQTGASVLKETLLEVLQERTPNRESACAVRPDGPQYVLLLAAPELFHGNDFFAKLAKTPNAGIRVIYLCNSLVQLPKECGIIVETDGAQGCMYARDSAGTKCQFTPERADSRSYEAFARAMAPLRLSESAGKRTIPNSISFLEGYNLNRMEDYDIRSAWMQGKTRNSFAVPIGIDENGEKFYFDIQDGVHGVHGLVGGMSGSGKSEMLQSWLLSMAMNFSPQEVSFVLIDFKGTGLITPFIGLPHLAGTISDIHVSSDIRRSKESLEYELKRREILFDSYGVQNIQAYRKLRHTGAASEALPILIVVIDEFAEFKKTFPEFMKWVESSFARGRSVGIWFILATQQPGSDASDALKTNTHFKWCLKVSSAAASKDMIGIPDAAQITRPGRAYIKVSGTSANFLTQVQSFWSGAPYRANREQNRETQRIASVDIAGNRTYCTEPDGSTGYKSGKTEIEAAVLYIAKFAERNGIPAASRIWADRLGERIPLSAVCSRGFDGRRWPECAEDFRVTVGEVDDPGHQQKYPLVVPFTDGGHIVVYGAPTTGKTTFLQTLLLSAALNYSPADLNIYILDFGSLSMRVFASMPHVGGIAEMGQDSRISKLVGLLRDELEHRKNLFARAGVISMSAYRAIPNAERLPYVLLVVDNFNPVLSTYPDLDSFFVTLTQSGAGYGIYLAASATGANGFSFKLKDSIRLRYALRLAEDSDYSGIVNHTEGLYPENVMGRGLVRGTPPLQFQTALPADGATDREISDQIRAIAAQMQKSWMGKCAKRIPEMPEVITYGSIAGSGVYLGLSVRRVEPVEFDYHTQHYLMISGMSGAGKSNLLKVLANQMYTVANCTVYALDISGTSLRSLAGIGTYMDKATDINAFFDDLMPKLRERQERGSAAGGFAPILLVIDDFPAFYAAVSEKTVRRILAIIKLCGGLSVYLLLAGDAGDLARKRIQAEEITMSCVTAKQAVLLGGYINDHGAFHLKPTQAQRNTELGEKEGFFVSKDGIIQIKTMQDRKL